MTSHIQFHRNNRIILLCKRDFEGQNGLPGSAQLGFSRPRSQGKRHSQPLRTCLDTKSHPGHVRGSQLGSLNYLGSHLSVARSKTTRRHYRYLRDLKLLVDKLGESPDLEIDSRQFVRESNANQIVMIRRTICNFKALLPHAIPYPTNCFSISHLAGGATAVRRDCQGQVGADRANRNCSPPVQGCLSPLVCLDKG